MYFSSDIKLFLVKLILPMGCVAPIALKSLKQNFNSNCILNEIGHVVPTLEYYFKNEKGERNLLHSIMKKMAR